MGLFWGLHGWGKGAKSPTPLPKICHTYPTWIKLSTVIEYPRPKKKSVNVNEKFIPNFLAAMTFVFLLSSKTLSQYFLDTSIKSFFTTSFLPHLFLTTSIKLC